MKLGIISDIHLDINEGYPVMDILADLLKKEQCEGLILAGDISSKADQTFEWLEPIREKIQMPLWFVPGNHDMWDPERKYTNTWEIYEKYKAEKDCLCGKAIVLNEDTVITGSLGWYDYTFGSEGYSLEEFDKKSRGGRTWQDSLFAHWGEDDASVCRKMVKELSDVLEANKGKKIITVTHMLSIPEFCVDPANGNWDYFNAFLGSSAFGKLFEDQHILCSIMGHVHYREQLVRNGVDYRCACLGYFNEWPTPVLKDEVADSLQFIEI